ncbi:Protein png1 [Didymosphaeria variabile]|uniref:Protein png1 n=1 Tax=Didymosphaeria variabile TaxID=1932322 RepID=A0A9W8XD19_9PLEO|nr:Protein png1 [Didymosphaeria variabile]KAJ4346381.1 Protein png1 [Didymosphaeria variabile]
MSSQQLWSSLKRKPRWPNPEESIGQFYGEKQGRLCWRAQGAAREAFSQVAPAIKEYLNSCSDAVPGADWVTWSIYMIGKSKFTAVPTIMFECFQKGPRKEAMDMVRKSGILNQHPGIETGHWSFPPNIVFPQQLALTSLQSDSTSSDLDRAVGPQITVQTFSNGSVEHRKATVGGLLCAKGKNYYFTVNHPFSSGHRIVPWPSSLADFDDECEFGGQSDAEDDENDDALADVTSGGSRTPESSSGCNSDDDAANNGSLDSSGSEEISIIAPEKLRSKTCETVSDGRIVRYLPAGESSDVDPGDERLLRKEKADPVAVSNRDLCIASTVLDYALILSEDDDIILSVSAHVSVPFSKGGIPYMSLKNVADKIPEIASIITMTGSSGLITGMLSGSPSYTRLPGAGAYQEVFTVKLDGPLHPGDCGSCVFSAETGALYGHIVAGSTVTQIAYILPAAVVFQDISLQIERLNQRAASFKTYPSYCFEFGQLEKHLTRIDSLPPPPTRSSTTSILYDDALTNDPEVEAATQNAMSLLRSSPPKDSTSIPDTIIKSRGPVSLAPTADALFIFATKSVFAGVVFGAGTWSEE